MTILLTRKSLVIPLLAHLKYRLLLSTIFSQARFQKKIIKKSINVLLVRPPKDAMNGCIPLFPLFYQWYSKPEYDFVYEIKYTKNPIYQWNRDIDKILDRWDEMIDKRGEDESRGVLLKQITEELYDAFPLITASIGLKPFDKSELKIRNLRISDIKDFRIHFTGCKDIDSIKTYPDQFSKDFMVEKEGGEDVITVKYHKIPGRPRGTYAGASIKIFGEDTSNCSVSSIYANTSNGDTAIGKELKIYKYLDELHGKQKKNYERYDVVTRIILTIVILILYYRLNSISKKLNTI